MHLNWKLLSASKVVGDSFRGEASVDQVRTNTAPKSTQIDSKSPSLGWSKVALSILRCGFVCIGKSFDRSSQFTDSIGNVLLFSWK